jgi:hypothetical protein
MKSMRKAGRVARMLKMKNAPILAGKTLRNGPLGNFDVDGEYIKMGLKRNRNTV